MFKGITSLLVVAALVTFVGCGKKKGNTKPVNPQKPAAASNDPKEAIFNGDWISDCVPSGDGNYRVDFWSFYNGGIFREIARYSSDTCDTSSFISSSDVFGTFTVASDSTTISGAKNVNKMLNGAATYDMWFLHEDAVFFGLKDDAHLGNTPATRPIEIDYNTIYRPFNP